MKIKIRPARIDDAEAICSVIRKSITSCCSDDHRNEPALIAAWLSNKTSSNIAIWISDQHAIPLVAEQDGRIVGFILIAGSELSLCYVIPEVLHQGIGKALLIEAESQAVASSRGNIRLSSTRTAQPFYLRNGYTCSGASQQWSGLDAQPMHKTLSV